MPILNTVIKLNEESNNNSKNSINLKRFLKEKEPKKPEFIIAIIVNIILLYVVNNLVSWNISFITASFNDILWILNISIVANIVANIIFLIYFSGWLKSLIQILLNILGILVIYYLYVIFPFVFSNIWITWGLGIALILALFGMVIAIFIEAARFILIYIIKIDN
jgi:hypothetical protein